MVNQVSSAIKDKENIFNLHHISKEQFNTFKQENMMNEYNIPMKHVKKSNQVDFYRFTAYDQEVIISYFKNEIIFYGLELSP